MIQPMEITIVADVEDMDELEEIIAKAREVEKAFARDTKSVKISVRVIKRRKESE